MRDSCEDANFLCLMYFTIVLQDVTVGETGSVVHGVSPYYFLQLHMNL
jgi:hypothetical protein